MSQDQSRDYSVVGFAVEGMKALAEKDEAIQRLQEERKQLKAQIIEGIKKKLGEVPLAQAFDVASDAYWADPILADAVKKAYMAATRRGLMPRPFATEVPCERCGNLVTAKAWTQYKDIMDLEQRRQSQPERGWASTLCESCTQISQAASNERYRESSQAYYKQQAAYEAERQRALEALWSMPYDEYLQTEHWQLLEQAAVKRAGYRCQLCNAQGVLNAHLRSDEHRGNEALKDIAVLCDTCYSTFRLVQDINDS